MGGNALASVGAVRQTAHEYRRLTGEVLVKLYCVFIGRVKPIRAYTTKETFGDCDILVEDLELNWTPVDYRGTRVPEWLEQVFILLDVKHFVQNKPAYSFLYSSMQVDLIVAQPEEYEASYDYFAWNDLGNLVGRVAHKMGFKYGHRGLVHVMRHDETNAYGEVVITNMTSAIYAFLGYDYRRFAQGFETIEDIWKFTATTPFFNREIYQLDNVNSKARVRDIKRPTYTGFLKWLETQQGLPYSYNWAGMEREVRREYWLKRALQVFPDFAVRYEKAKLIEDNKIEGARKWNGELVSRWTGLTGKDLGNLMRRCRTRNWCQQPILHMHTEQELFDFTMEEFRRVP